MNIKNEMKDLVDQQNILYVTRNLKQIFSFEEESEGIFCTGNHQPAEVRKSLPVRLWKI